MIKMGWRNAQREKIMIIKKNEVKYKEIVVFPIIYLTYGLNA